MAWGPTSVAHWRALARRPDRPAVTLFSNAENDGKLRAEFPDAEVVASGVAATNRVARILAEGLAPRLTEDQIRSVAVYVHALGGGE